jgi:hypothetical protein
MYYSNFFYRGIILKVGRPKASWARGGGLLKGGDSTRAKRQGGGRFPSCKIKQGGVINHGLNCTLPIYILAFMYY